MGATLEPILKQLSWAFVLISKSLAVSVMDRKKKQKQNQKYNLWRNNCITLWYKYPT